MPDKWLVIGCTPRLIFCFLQEDGETPVDVSAADSMIIRLERPGGTTVDKTAVHLTSGIDGKVYYQLAAADTTAKGAGTYKARAYAHMPDGKVHKTRIFGFFVYSDLAEPA